MLEVVFVMASPIPPIALQPRVYLISYCLKKSFIHSFYIYTCVYISSQVTYLFSD